MYKSPSQSDDHPSESIEPTSPIKSNELEISDVSSASLPQQSSDSNTPILVSLRWQVVILGLNYVMPMTVGRYLDPVVQGFVNFLMSTVIGGVGAGLVYLFFTASSKGKFLRNQRFLSLFVSIVIIIGAWLDWKRNYY